MLKTEGKSYVTISGKVIAEKSLRRACNCRKKCYEQLSDDVRLVIFKHFYSLSQSGQNQFLANNVEESEKKVQRIRGIRKNRSRRKYTRNYFLFENQNRIEVCQTMFLNTLNVSLKKVRVIVEKKRNSSAGICVEDGRGKHQNHPIIPQAEKDFIKEHIQMFPTYSSHYSREQTEKRYLSSDLSISVMYKLYRVTVQKNFCRRV